MVGFALGARKIEKLILMFAVPSEKGLERWGTPRRG